MMSRFYSLSFNTAVGSMMWLMCMVRHTFGKKFQQTNSLINLWMSLPEPFNQ